MDLGRDGRLFPVVGLLDDVALTTTFVEDERYTFQWHPHRFPKGFADKDIDSFWRWKVLDSKRRRRFRIDTETIDVDEKKSMGDRGGLEDEEGLETADGEAKEMEEDGQSKKDGDTEIKDEEKEEQGESKKQEEEKARDGTVVNAVVTLDSSYGKKTAVEVTTKGTTSCGGRGGLTRLSSNAC